MHVASRRCALVAALALGLGAGGCAGPAGKPGSPSYRVTWTARRASDGASLGRFTSPPAQVGGPELRLKADSRPPEETRPTFAGFVAKIRPMPGASTVELQTRASVRETYRTKKGKLKVAGRFLGALLPIRPGETLGVSGPGDPIDLRVQIDR